MMIRMPVMGVLLMVSLLNATAHAEEVDTVIEGNSQFAWSLYQQLKEHGMSDNDLKDIYRMRLKAYNESKDKEVAKLKDILPDYQDYLDKGLTEEQVIKIAKARVSLENTKKES